MKDHLGSIRQTLNQSGTVMSAMDYYAFGGTMSSYVNGNTVDKYKFTGKERDTETGLDYFGARYYDSKIGRWMSVDPLADMYQGLSPYNYCKNNPLDNTDPDGRGLDSTRTKAIQEREEQIKRDKENAKKEWEKGNYFSAIGNAFSAFGGIALKAIDEAGMLPGPAAIELVTEGSFFTNTYYSEKVIDQMTWNDTHAFPEVVKKFEKSGTVSTITGGDGKVRQVLRIPGEYKGHRGEFTFMKEPNGKINHRQFEIK